MQQQWPQCIGGVNQLHPGVLHSSRGFLAVATSFGFIGFCQVRLFSPCRQGAVVCVDIFRSGAIFGIGAAMLAFEVAAAMLTEICGGDFLFSSPLAEAEASVSSETWFSGGSTFLGSTFFVPC